MEDLFTRIDVLRDGEASDGPGGWHAVMNRYLDSTVRRCWVSIIEAPARSRVKSITVSAVGHHVDTVEGEFKKSSEHVNASFGVLNRIIERAISERVPTLIFDVRQGLVRRLLTGEFDPGTTAPLVRTTTFQLGRAHAAGTRVFLFPREIHSDIFVELTVADGARPVRLAEVF